MQFDTGGSESDRFKHGVDYAFCKEVEFVLCAPLLELFHHFSCDDLMAEAGEMHWIAI